jgi:hypothetical protein
MKGSENVPPEVETAFIEGLEWGCGVEANPQRVPEVQTRLVSKTNSRRMAVHASVETIMRFMTLMRSIAGCCNSRGNQMSDE